MIELDQHYLAFENLSSVKDVFNFTTTRAVTQADALKHFKIDKGSFVRLKQVHSDIVHVVNLSNAGDEQVEGDALITDTAGLCIIVSTADCVPGSIVDAVNKVVAVYHGGWRGTLNNIAGKTIEVMIDKFGSNPEDLLVGIGPSIGPDDYTVGPDVVEGYTNQGYQKYLKSIINGGGWKLDLWGVNIHQLVESGIKRKNIELANISTFSNPNKFPSFRYEKQPTGGFRTGLMLK